MYPFRSDTLCHTWPSPLPLVGRHARAKVKRLGKEHIFPWHASWKFGPTAGSSVELIKLMEKNGIGTDATIAEHISKLQARNYMRKDGNNRFSPTSLGLVLVNG